MSFIPSIESLNDAHDRALFDELVSVYIRLVEVFCEKNKIPQIQPINDFSSIVAEIIKIGFINKKESSQKTSMNLQFCTIQRELFYLEKMEIARA